MFGLNLPDYPWDALIPYRQRAANHSDRTVDLSIGTPVDPTPEFIRSALREAADWHGYPTTAGTKELRASISEWYERRREVPQLSPEATLPTVGSKEFIAWLPFLLGLKPGDLIIRPAVAYPTYDIGAEFAGVESLATDDLSELSAEQRERVKLVWVNSPGNPTGMVRSIESLRNIVDEARALGAVVASDECYAELGWDSWDTQGEAVSPVPSVLHPLVAQGSHENLLSVYSLSKQSNLAGYRAAFAAGDPALIANLTNSRKHAGMIVPGPIQNAMIAALGDDAHVRLQKDRYRNRRALLKTALESSGLQVTHSEAGLYLWVRATRAGVGCWDILSELADMGIVAGPGAFYGELGQDYVRVALTATDERVEAAAQRLKEAHFSFSA